MNQLILNIPVGILLIVCSWTDIKKKMISGVFLGIFAVLGIVINAIFLPNVFLSVCGGIVFGLIIMGISKLTKGAIGMGDGGLICVTGLYLGFYKNLELFLLALFMAAIWGIILIVVRKAGRKTELPFVPFMMMAYIVMMLSQVNQIDCS